MCALLHAGRHPTNAHLQLTEDAVPVDVIARELARTEELETALVLQDGPGPREPCVLLLHLRQEWKASAPARRNRQPTAW
jgi:hypothetical protein